MECRGLAALQVLPLASYRSASFGRGSYEPGQQPGTEKNDVRYTYHANAHTKAASWAITKARDKSEAVILGSGGIFWDKRSTERSHLRESIVRTSDSFKRSQVVHVLQRRRAEVGASGNATKSNLIQHAHSIRRRDALCQARSRDSFCQGIMIDRERHGPLA